MTTAKFPRFTREDKGDYTTIKNGTKFYLYRLMSGNWSLMKCDGKQIEKVAIVESKKACYMLIHNS